MSLQVYYARLVLSLHNALELRSPTNFVGIGRGHSASCRYATLCIQQSRQFRPA